MKDASGVEERGTKAIQLSLTTCSHSFCDHLKVLQGVEAGERKLTQKEKAVKGLFAEFFKNIFKLNSTVLWFLWIFTVVSH